MNTKILVCCHKECDIPNNELYLPIHVGSSLSDKHLNFVRDNTGDNISDKNGSYCELTGMYWAWKNLKDVDVIGLCHYRRFFDYHHQCQRYIPLTEFSVNDYHSIDFSIPDELISRVTKGEIVVSSKLHYWETLKQDYCSCHISDDYRAMSRIIHETEPKHIADAFDCVIENGNKLICYNMFVMRWCDFDAYCNWLFPLLERIELEIDISHYNNVQKRIFGYMAERLFNVWLFANKKPTIQRPVIWFVDSPHGKKNSLLYKMRDLIWDGVNCMNIFSHSLTNKKEF